MTLIANIICASFERIASADRAQRTVVVIGTLARLVISITLEAGLVIQTFKERFGLSILPPEALLRSNLV